MAQSRTAKGTAASKTSGTALTISGVQLDAGQSVVVGIAWEDEGQTDKPTVKWGNRELRYIADSEQSRGDTVVRQYRARIRKNGTKDITAVWPNAKTARAMIATQIAEASRRDVRRSNAGGDTSTAPATGAAATTTVANTVHLAFFAMIGPTTDAVPTANLGHTIGQRVGTSGPPPKSNITLVETYELLTATGDCRATISLTTARAYAATIVAYKAAQLYKIARAEYVGWDGNPESESVRFVVEDESTNPMFTTVIPRSDFEEMTDAEVTTYIKGDCQWWEAKQREGAPSPDFTPDAAFNTRVAGFVNDEISI